MMMNVEVVGRLLFPLNLIIEIHRKINQTQKDMDNLRQYIKTNAAKGYTKKQLKASLLKQGIKEDKINNALKKL